jgi:hypothetical protein
MHDHPAGPGHNAVEERREPVQWQTPHLPHDHIHDHDEAEPDLDLVEAAFVEGFEAASDPTSFLRLAGVPFRASWNGRTIDLLRVAIDLQCDVAAVTPMLGGGHKVAPLPASLVGKRRSLALHYVDEKGLVSLGLAQARELEDLTPKR